MGLALKGINGAQRKDSEGNFVVPSMAACAMQIEQRHEGAAMFAPTDAAPRMQQKSRFNM